MKQKYYLILIGFVFTTACQFIQKPDFYVLSLHDPDNKLSTQLQNGAIGIGILQQSPANRKIMVLEKHPIYDQFLKVLRKKQMDNIVSLSFTEKRFQMEADRKIPVKILNSISEIKDCDIAILLVIHDIRANVIYGPQSLDLSINIYDMETLERIGHGQITTQQNSFRYEQLEEAFHLLFNSEPDE